MLQFPIVLLVIITGTPPSLKLLLLIITILFLNQLITARGLPVAVQVKLTSSPDVTVVYFDCSIMLGTTTEINRINFLPITNFMLMQQSNLCTFHYVLY